MQEVAAQALAVFLVVTLASTGLAKLVSLRLSAASVTVELSVPLLPAQALVTAAITAELTLAAMIAFSVSPSVTGCATALLFAVFAGYRTLAAARTGTLSCSCAGPAQDHSQDRSVSRTAARTDAAGRTASCILLAAAALTWASLQQPSHGEHHLPLSAVIALALPVAAFAIGQGHRFRTRQHLARMPQRR
jgi:hypothetical protein